MAEKFPKYGYLECSVGKGMFSNESLFNFVNSRGGDVSGFVNKESIRKIGEKSYMSVTVIERHSNNELSIVLPAHDIYGDRAELQQVNLNQIVYEK